MNKQINYLQTWDLAPEYMYKKYNGFPIYKNTSSHTPLYNGIYENRLVRHTIDSISKRHHNTEDSDSIDEILQDRKNLIRSKIEMLLLQLSQRKSINQEITQRINYDLCKAQTLIMEMGYDIHGISRNKLPLEKIKFDLEGQIRMEQTSYFRDTGMLNRDLRDALVQYIDQVQKDSLIDGLEVEK